MLERKLRCRKTLRNFGIVLLVLGIVLQSNLSFAADVCFPEETDKKIIVDLETCKTYKDETALLEKGNEELKKQIDLLKQVNKLQQEQLEISKQTVDSQKELLKTQKELYEKQIANMKPSFIDKLLLGLAGLGIGVVAGALIF